MNDKINPMSRRHARAGAPRGGDVPVALPAVSATPAEMLQITMVTAYDSQETVHRMGTNHGCM